MKNILKHKTVSDFIKNTVLQNLVISDKQIKQLQELLDSGIELTPVNRRSLIKDMIISGVDDDYVYRIKRLFEIGTKTHSLEQYILRYGEEIGNFKYDYYCSSLTRSISSYIEKYGEEEGNKKYINYCNNHKGFSKEFYVEKYGEEEGSQKWSNYLLKRKNGYIISREKRGGKFNNGRSLAEYINKHGEEEGTKLWQIRNKKQSNRFSIEFYVEKYGEKEGLQKWVEYCLSMDKASYLYFKNKYGVDNGKKYWNERSLKIKKSLLNLDFDKFKEKYGDNAKIIYENILQLYADRRSNYSKISQKLFWLIFDNFKQKENIKFAELNEEETIYYFENNQKKYYKIDFLYNNNKIIEYNGELFHDYNNPLVLERDEKKCEILKSMGFKIKIVWEKDFKNNMIDVLNECLNFLYDKT